MSHRDISLTIALCASLVLHALLVGSAAEVYARAAGRIWLPGFPRQDVITTLLFPHDEDVEDPMQRLGGIGKGEALATSPGETPMVAPKANQTQAFLSLDPEGQGKIGEDPTDSVLPLAKPGASGTPSEPAERSRPAPEEAQAHQSPPFGVPTEGGDFALPQVVKKQEKQEPTEMQPEEVVQASSSPPSPPAQASPMVASQGTPGAERSADPAPQAETESDPVSVVGGVDFRRGSTDVRLGRRYKIIRPHLSVAAQADLVTRASPSLVLKIRIDETGKVTSADIFRSSGSNDVDQPCKLAAYNWWFEPAKDKAGKPVKDVILFAIRFI